MDTGYYIKFIVSSLLVIGFLLIVLKYARRAGISTGNKHMKILDRLALGSQSNLFIVDIKGTEYVIGATNQHIQLIDKR